MVESVVEKAKRPSRFNIRVYGICLKKGKLLLVSEKMRGFEFTKFPGGGLEFGEGIQDALTREFEEELSVRIKILRHYYTTEFYQVSAFNPEEQLISIYYLVELPDMNEQLSFPFHSEQSETHTLLFDWQELKNLNEDDVTFPVDKVVLKMLRSDFCGV